MACGPILYWACPSLWGNSHHKWAINGPHCSSQNDWGTGGEASAGGCWASMPVFGAPGATNDKFLPISVEVFWDGGRRGGGKTGPGGSDPGESRYSGRTCCHILSPLLHLKALYWQFLNCGSVVAHQWVVIQFLVGHQTEGISVVMSIKD